MSKKAITELKKRRDDLDISFLRKVECGQYDIKIEDYVKKNKSHNTRNRIVKDQQNSNHFKHSYYNRISGDIKVYFADRA